MMLGEAAAVAASPEEAVTADAGLGGGGTFVSVNVSPPFPPTSPPVPSRLTEPFAFTSTLKVKL
jgi:hypothetical protein